MKIYFEDENCIADFWKVTEAVNRRLYVAADQVSESEE